VSKKSDLEAEFAYQIKVIGLAEPKREYKFHPTRKWRLDFAWDEKKIGVEIQGGTYKGGRHTRALGYRNDREKINNATLLGWRILEFTSDMVKSGEALNITEALLKEQKWTN
jgi:very-short-patch-repair endonuclease